MYFRYSWLSLFLIALCTPVMATAMEVGFNLERFEDEPRERPILIDWWYPVDGQAASDMDYGLGHGKVVEAGAVATGTFPLVVLSHGAMGAARNYSWIAEALARHGYIVAGVSHFGESYVYGPEAIDPSAVLRPWERPLDISAALSFIEKQGLLSASIDMQRVGFLGHSSGGATALQLAGAVFDGKLIAEYCATANSAGDRGCDYDSLSAKADPSKTSSTRAPQSYAEPRILAFVALDPALGPGFDDYEKVDPNLKTLVVGSVDNDFLPFRHHAERIAAGLPNVQTHWLSNGEGHFVYLNECESDLEANGVSLCNDRQGVSRQAVHNELKTLIRDFFDLGLTSKL